STRTPSSGTAGRPELDARNWTPRIATGVDATGRNRRTPSLVRAAKKMAVRSTKTVAACVDAIDQGRPPRLMRHAMPGHCTRMGVALGLPRDESHPVEAEPHWQTSPGGAWQTQIRALMPH